MRPSSAGEGSSGAAGFQILEVFGEKTPSRLPSDPPLVFNGDFLLEFFPAAPPVAQVGTNLCSAALRPGARHKWAPFNSSFVWSGIGLGIKLPPDPGGTAQPPPAQYLEVSDISNVEYLGLTGWTVDIKYLRPPAP